MLWLRVDPGPVAHADVTMWAGPFHLQWCEVVAFRCYLTMQVIGVA